jgi:hypothetical protein
MKKIRDVARLNNLTGNKSTSIYVVYKAARKILNDSKNLFNWKLIYNKRVDASKINEHTCPETLQ